MDNATQGLTGRALGEAVIDTVLTYPEMHDQCDVVQDTSCGTTACIAGWTIALHHGLNAGRLTAPAFHRLRPLCHVDPWLEASELLGIDVARFGSAVYGEMDESAAIANFKHLLDEAHSEPLS